MRKPIDKDYLKNTLDLFNQHVLNNEYAKKNEIVEGHTHENKDVLDKLSEDSDGILLFNGNQIEGSTGTSGKSAYEIAVDNGFVGTETEWLESLKGSDGDKGDNGTTPHIGENNNWFIGDTDTGILAQGANGVDGKDGKSISTITKDDDNNIIVTFTDGSTQNIGRLSIDISADFLTESGFGNIRYYRGKFQYYDKDKTSWVDLVFTGDNQYIINMIPSSMKSVGTMLDTKNKTIKLKMIPPSNTIINGQLACVVDGVKVIRKVDSAPTGVDDPDAQLVVDIKSIDFDNYTDKWFADTLGNFVEGKTYYYHFYPYSDLGFYNTSSTSITKQEYRSYNVFEFTLNQSESDPSNMITYGGDNEYFTPAHMDYDANKFDYGDWTVENGAWFMDVKPCMLKYDGTVDYALDKNDYSKKLDGSPSDIINDSYDGNAMVGVPKVYWKVTNINNYITEVRFSDKKVDSDYVCWSHLDNNGNEIPYCYMPCYTGAIVNNKLRSLSGKSPIHSYSGTSEISYAIANNQTDDTIWYTETFSDRVLINMLLLLIGKSTDTQTIFGNGHYAGGDGAGSNIASGTMNTKGLFYGTNGTWTGVKVFGMEHYWGNQWRRIAGWINSYGTQKIKLTYGQSDGSTVDGYNTDGTGYIEIPNSTPSGSSGGYISKLLFGNYGYTPVISNGSATTYCCDGLWFNNGQIDYALVGGASNGGYLVGAFCSYLDSAFSVAVWAFAAALSCKPLA